MTRVYFLVGFSIIAAFSSFLTPTLAHAAIGDVPTYGLVGHWQFDTSTGTTTDASGNGYTATMGNNPTVVAGIAGDALQFATTTGNNNNYVGFPASLQYANFPQSGTLSFWIKGTFSTQATNMCIFDCFSGRAHIYVTTYTSGRLQTNLQKLDTNYVSANAQRIFSANGNWTAVNISDGVWTHVVMIWDTVNKMGFVYTNGSLKLSYFWGANDPTWTPSSQKFQINATSSASASAEIIDDVALFSRPLSISEISAIYSGSAIPPADTSAPTAPTNLAGSPFSSTKVTLGWLASTDDTAVSGYIIYRNGSPVGYASSTALSYLDYYLVPNTSYTYTVRAFDASGNQSPDSAPVTVTTTATKILLQSTFEEDNTANTAEIAPWTQSGPNSDAVVVTTEQARAGSQSVKYSFNYSDWQAGDTNYHQRAEIGESTTTNLTLGQTYWLGISEYLPSNWTTDNFANGELIWQFHGSSNGPAYNSSPPIALYINGPEVYLTVHGATTTAYTGGQSLPTAHLATFSLDELKGKWTDWVLQLNVNYSGGFINAWKNGVKVASYTGPTIYHSVGQTTEIGPKLQIGTYKWGWGSSATLVSNRTLYADELRIADNTASCSDVTPSDAVPCSADQEVFTSTSTSPAVNLITLSSDIASTSVANVGNVVTLSFSVEQTPMVLPTATIAGRSVPMIAGTHYTDSYGTDRYPYSASTTIQSSDSEGPVSISAVVGNYNGQGTTTVNRLLYGPNVTIDKTAPTIALRGASTDSVYVGPSYADPGASATDSHDGSVSVTTSGTVNTAVAGTYTLTYTAADAAGNSAHATRTVTVKSLGNGPIVGSYSAPVAISPSTSPVAASSTNATTTSPVEEATMIETLHTQIDKLTAQLQTLLAARASKITAIASTLSFTRDIYFGIAGPDVSVLQRLLKEQGYFTYPGITGYFGHATKAAVAAFQKAHGIVPLGGVGPLTRAALNSIHLR